MLCIKLILKIETKQSCHFRAFNPSKKFPSILLKTKGKRQEKKASSLGRLSFSIFFLILFTLEIITGQAAHNIVHIKEQSHYKQQSQISIFHNIVHIKEQ